jgi:hypothetical protein
MRKEHQIGAIRRRREWREDEDNKNTKERKKEEEEHDTQQGDTQTRGKGSLWPVEETSKQLTGLVGIIIDGLLSKNHQVRLLALRQGTQRFGHLQRFQHTVSLHVDTTIRTHRNGSAQSFLALLRTHAHGHHLKKKK